MLSSTVKVFKYLSGAASGLLVSGGIATEAVAVETKDQKISNELTLAGYYMFGVGALFGLATYQLHKWQKELAEQEENKPLMPISNETAHLIPDIKDSNPRCCGW